MSLGCAFTLLLALIVVSASLKASKQKLSCRNVIIHPSQLTGIIKPCRDSVFDPFNFDSESDSFQLPKIENNSVKKLVVGAIIFGMISNPEPSFASFGSGGAAVSSQPVIKSLTPQQYMQLSLAKQRQRNFGTVCGKIGVCERDVDALTKEFKAYEAEIKRLESKISNASGEENKKVEKDEKLRINIEQQLAANAAFLDKLGQQPPWVSYAAAAAGSCVSTLIMHPLDTLKTRIMTGERDKKRKSQISNDDESEKLREWTNPLEGLYSGVIANVVKEAPASALYLGIYEAMRTFFMTTDLSQYPLIIYLLSGAIGEVGGSLVRAPAEAVKIRMQTSDVNAITAITQVLEPKGIKNTIKAWQVSLWRDVPMGAIQLALFESIKSFVINSPTLDFDVNTLLAEAIFGTIGGGIGALVSAPADRVTILMLASLETEMDLNIANTIPLEKDILDASINEDCSIAMSEEENNNEIGSYTVVGVMDRGNMVRARHLKNQEDIDESSFDLVKRLYREEGIGSFFAGAAERTVYWAIAISIFLSVYCSLRRNALDFL